MKLLLWSSSLLFPPRIRTKDPKHSNQDDIMQDVVFSEIINEIKTL